jgi:pyruvate decarboxylase
MPGFTIGNYLATRLEQIGLKHYFVVPGDYNLVLLDQLLANENMQLINCCNELNASYAAEGYARVNGCGAVFTTMNVGSFSALNGVAGAYAERLPVIFVASSYNTNDASANHIVHHSIGTHDYSYQYEMVKYVTCAAVRIVHPDNAPSMIDDAIRTALRERKPAYIEIACNLSDAPCVQPGPYEAITAPEESNSHALAAAVDGATAMLAGAKKPILLAGAHLRCSYGAIDAFREVAEALGCGVAVMADAKGFFPEDHPQYIGIYWGPTSSPGVEAVMDWSDLILAAGPVFSDYTTVGWTGEPPADRMINASARDVRFPDAEYTNVALADFLAGLAKNVRANDATLTQYRRIVTVPAQSPAVDPSAPLTRAELWRQIELNLDSQTTLMCETGDSWYNGTFTRLPGGARFEIEMQWGSIGWATGAAFGYAMGLEPDRRLVEVTGDGSFQLTAQEVANMIRYGQETLIFLVNNRGYVVESAIHDGPYNYFKNWDYAGLIDVWNAEDGHGLGLKATTGKELSDAITRARRHKRGPVLIECQIAHDDCSPMLLEWGSKVATANARPHQQT